MQTDLFMSQEADAPAIVLRPYQGKAVEGLLRSLHLNPILAAPTGSGKTVMGVEAVRRHGGRWLWVAHRVELIDQAAKAVMSACHEPVGFIKAGYKPDPAARIQVASIQTLSRRTFPEVDGLLIDECHHACAASYLETIGHYDAVPRIGLTATPFRLDGKGLGEAGFGTIIVAAYVDELVEQGYLHAPKVYVGETPDLRGLRKLGGDYQRDALSERVCESRIVGNIVELWKLKAEGRRTVVFAVDVAHSQMVVQQFRDAGIVAEHVDGTTDPLERRATLQRLADGHTTVVSNCQVLTEGWDLPALECAVVARPTASLNLHLQMLGRIMRSAEDKGGAIVLDHAGNHYAHGQVTRRIAYSLDGRIAGESEPLDMRRCKQCFVLFSLSKRVCPECGWEVPRQPEGRKITHVDGSMVEYDDVAEWKYRQAVYRSLVAQAEHAGYAPGWVGYRYKELFGDWPVVADGDLVSPATADIAQKREVYRGLVQTAKNKGFKIGWASHRYKQYFGVWPSGFVEDVRSEVLGPADDERQRIRDKFTRLSGRLPMPAFPRTGAAEADEGDEDDEEDLF